MCSFSHQIKKILTSHHHIPQRENDSTLNSGKSSSASGHLPDWLYSSTEGHGSSSESRRRSWWGIRTRKNDKLNQFFQVTLCKEFPRSIRYEQKAKERWKLPVMCNFRDTTIPSFFSDFYWVDDAVQYSRSVFTQIYVLSEMLWANFHKYSRPFNYHFTDNTVNNISWWFYIGFSQHLGTICCIYIQIKINKQK